MRAKHHYKVLMTVYEYVGSEWLECSRRVEKTTVLYETNKRADAERYYYNNLYRESGCELKGMYYPWVSISFVKEY